MPSATFHIHTVAFPADWHEFKKEINAASAKRSTDSHPIWMRINGMGFAIWLSEVTLYKSSTNPPIWEIKMEILSELPLEGKQLWDEAYSNLCSFFDKKELTYTIS